MINFREATLMTKFKQILLFFTLCVAVSGSYAAPKLNFTDLISGPDTGLGDGIGSGVVVTLWGQGLGSTQGSSTITFTDSSNQTAHTAHVYYWKNADGNLPSGPANLFESHKMQEIAVSIPDMASGAGTLQVTVDGVISNSMPFTIRAGNIYHVKASGNDSTGNGSFANPWLTMDSTFDDVNDAGATIYVHDSLVSKNYNRKTGGIYWNDGVATSGLANQYGVIAFPDSQPRAEGLSGFRNYNTAGQVVSKFAVFASNCDEAANGQPVNCDQNGQNISKNFTIGIQSSAFGRAVGNTVTDAPGKCADGQQGAINGNALNGDRVSGFKMLGNEIYDYGCEGTSKFHHTTYFSVRNINGENLQVDPWQMGWNYLHNNYAKFGLHSYDERHGGGTCGSPTGTVVINDNVVVDQAGSGISVGVKCEWVADFDIYNNVLIRTGGIFDWDGINPSSALGNLKGPSSSAIFINDNQSPGLEGDINIHNNTIIEWDVDFISSSADDCITLGGAGSSRPDETPTLLPNILFNDNICLTSQDRPFFGTNYNGATQVNNISGSNNVWYYGGTGTPTKAIKPSFDISNLIADPLISQINSQVTVGANSPIIGLSANSTTHDIYGVARLGAGEVGAVEFNLSVPSTNTSPVANPDTKTTEENTSVDIDVLANDTDVDSDTLVLSVVPSSSAQGGIVVKNGNGTIRYTPLLSFNGNDSFQYTVSDGKGGVDTATVTVNVTAVNDHPVAVDDSKSTAEDTALTLGVGDIVTSNDTDADGDVLHISAVSSPANGAIVLNTNGTVTFTPALNFEGTASFDYTVSDGKGGTDTATVTINVTAAPTSDNGSNNSGNSSDGNNSGSGSYTLFDIMLFMLLLILLQYHKRREFLAIGSDK